jgi:nucleoside-diphosphate-sugar epimerase
MKHLVLGSAGQIGSYLVEYLESQNETVFTYDIASHQEQDLRKYHVALESLIKVSDMVHFLAFDVGGAKYLEKYQNTFEFIDNNIKIMDVTFNLLKKHNKPFIFASSQMSYTQDSTYGLLKLVGEKYTKSLNGMYVKFWNVYGYEPTSEKSHVIPDFIKMAKETGHIKMRTTGKESRQFLYGEDCSECLYMLSKQYNEIDKSSPLHITNFEWNTIKEVAEIISELSGCTIEITDREDQTQKNNRQEPDSYILNFWKPKTNLKQGIKKLFKLY